MTMQMSSEPTQFDPLLLEDGPGMRISANTIGTPYEYDGAGNLQKALVENVTVSRDRTRYTFHFRKDLVWSDGVKFQADEFHLAITRLVTAPIKVALSELFPLIDLAHTRTLDARTVEVKLQKPDPLFLEWCTLPSFAPIRADIIEIYRAKHTPIVPTLAAYQVTDYQREDSIVLKKNPHYYAADAVTIAEIKIRFIPDEAALLPLFKAGSIDILSKVPVLQLNEIKKVAQLAEVPVEAVTYLGLNTKKAPFNDKKNRQAFRHALSDQLPQLAQILNTGEYPAQTFLPMILWPTGFLSKTVLPGPNDIPSIPFTVQSDNGSRNQTILEFIQSVVKKKLHWTMNLDLQDWKAHYAKLKTNPDEAYRFGWQNPVNSPYVLYQVLRGHGANNFTGWANAKYDELIEALHQETRDVKKAALVIKIEDVLADEVPVIPLLQQHLRFAYSKQVLGFRANSFGVILFRELHLAETKTSAHSEN
jgi:ABC-type oligopeptide transport system substrate-binding subunit